ncbi:glutathione S-transferase family protein [Cereibacter sp. SYSU M97828]|nr:glutathione S-transferase family protein [Cereibacter flavus]
MLRDCELSVTAFDWVPGFAQGLVRDLRVRWALEEAGIPYGVDLLNQGTQGGAANLARQPFGQVPSLRMGDGSMFESGAIVWRIAQESDVLLPSDAAGRDAALSWLFAALNTVEPPISMLAQLEIFSTDKEAATRLRPEIVDAIRLRLSALERELSGRDWLTDRFTVGDLMMAAVLRMVDRDMLGNFPAVSAYLDRCIDRPAFRKALADQLRPFAQNEARYASMMQ